MLEDREKKHSLICHFENCFISRCPLMANLHYAENFAVFLGNFWISRHFNFAVHYKYNISRYFNFAFGSRNATFYDILILWLTFFGKVKTTKSSDENNSYFSQLPIKSNTTFTLSLALLFSIPQKIK